MYGLSKILNQYQFNDSQQRLLIYLFYLSGSLDEAQLSVDLKNIAKLTEQEINAVLFTVKLAIPPTKGFHQFNPEPFLTINATPSSLEEKTHRWFIHVAHRIFTQEKNWQVGCEAELNLITEIWQQLDGITYSQQYDAILILDSKDEEEVAGRLNYVKNLIKTIKARHFYFFANQPKKIMTEDEFSLQIVSLEKPANNTELFTHFLKDQVKLQTYCENNANNELARYISAYKVTEKNHLIKNALIITSKSQLVSHQNDLEKALTSFNNKLSFNYEFACAHQLNFEELCMRIQSNIKKTVLISHEEKPNGSVLSYFSSFFHLSKQKLPSRQSTLSIDHIN